jgi:hypothetical protein
MNSNEIKSFAKSIKLTSVQREILVGTLLGDGHLETQNQGKTFRLKVEHSINQKDYTDWLYAKFKNLVLSDPQVKTQLVKGKPYQKYWFSTVSNGAMRFYGQLFYQAGKKVVPKFIAKLVTPLSLAVWFMDDGSLKSKANRARIINTQGFSDSDLQRLQDMLLNKFHIKTTLRNQKEGKQVYIPSTEIEKFITLIRPFVIPSMEYKIKVTTLPKV